MHDQDSHTAFVKVSIAWLGAFVGTITLQQVVLGLTGIYTVLQIYILLREKLFKNKKSEP